jgi:hypothetical protein
MLGRLQLRIVEPVSPPPVKHVFDPRPDTAWGKEVARRVAGLIRSAIVQPQNSDQLLMACFINERP